MARYDGRAGRTVVAAVRSTTEPRIDGELDEPMWAQAAHLTGFSQLLPVDGRPADDSTEVLVWYSPTAIHFGIRAYEAHGVVRATLADRDRIDAEDHVQIVLDTYLDRRRAFVFAVNALGVQADGTRGEGQQGGNTPRNGLANSDLSSDFIFESKGKLTEWGYQVEVRIPFKTLRYAGTKWGLQFVRQVQHSGFQDTWAPVKRGAASFLVQAGTLDGMRDLKRGLVLDLNPVVTNSVNGSPRGADGSSWGYANVPEIGGNVRWGLTSNLTMNATLNPDFSQVEADAQQVPNDIRFAVFFPERRPFFTDGIDLFQLPNQLVYTRRIVAPSSALRLSGKIGHADLAVLSAIDDRGTSVNGRDLPVFNIMRVRRDIGVQSWAGLTYTDRTEPTRSNRVLSGDARFVFGEVYNLSLQAVGSATHDPNVPAKMGTLWDVNMGRTGRAYGFRYALQGIDESFITRSGFVPRSDYVRAQIINRGSYFGPRGAFLQSLSTRFFIEGTSLYRDFFRRAPFLETKVQAQTDIDLRGGWRVNAVPQWETYAFDRRQYTKYRVSPTATRSDTVAFAVSDRIQTGGVQWRLDTPRWRRLTANGGGYIGRDPDFLETARANRFDLNTGLDWRPTSQLRVNPTYNWTTFHRTRDRSILSSAHIVRLKLEYQLTRAIFFRYVGQYDSRFRDGLRDPASDGRLLVKSGTRWIPTPRTTTNQMRHDWLFSYFPSPGTVIFAGYGMSQEEPESFRLREVERTRDNLFVKFSYLWRL